MNKRKKWLSAMLAIVLIVNFIPMNVIASKMMGHTHTESCYASAGDLLCKIPESEGHQHSEACHCPGGELICGQEENEGHTHTDSCYETSNELICTEPETEGHQHSEGCYSEDGALICGQEKSEGHTHTDNCYEITTKLVCTKVEGEAHQHSEECYCPGGELICGQEESEGHTHNEDCFAKGGELICGHTEQDGNEDTNKSNQMVDIKNGTINYEDIKNLFLADERIPFDPKTQTLCVVDITAAQSKYMKELNLYQADEKISEFEYWFDVFVDGQLLPEGTEYYKLQNNVDTISVVKTEKRYHTNTGTVYPIVAKSNIKELVVFIVDRGSSVEISAMKDPLHYSTLKESGWTDEQGNYYAGEEVRPSFADEQSAQGYSEVAASDVVNFPFAFEWNLSNFINYEIFTAIDSEKMISNPGFFWNYKGMNSYIDFFVEWRDQNGNVFPMPKDIYNNYGNDDFFLYMPEDGVIPIELSEETEDDHRWLYGEFDFYIPFGYDYRISVVGYGHELGGYAYLYNADHEYDGDGFAITGKKLTREPDEWRFEQGAFLEGTFMPLTQTIRIEKTTTGDAPADEAYNFQAKQEIYVYGDTKDYRYQQLPSHTQILSNYPYRVYNSLSDEEITEGTPYKTDKNGCFSLKANQYALFDVWELPEDFANYSEDGLLSFHDIFTKIPDQVPVEAMYSFEELSTGSLSTEIIHTHEGVEQSVDGRSIDHVVGNDQIVFYNRYSEQPTKDTGSLSVSKTVSGNEASRTQDFTFTVTLDDAKISGIYGEMTFVNGVATFKLKADESKTATGLPAGVHYRVEESDNSGYTVTVNDTTDTKAEGVITADKLAVAAFNNEKNGSSGGDSGGSGDIDPVDPVDPVDPPTTPDKPTNPDDPTTPDRPTNPDHSIKPEKPTTPDKPTNPDYQNKPNEPVDSNQATDSDKLIPETGDNDNIGTVAAFMVLSFVGLVLLTAYEMKRRTNKRSN